MKKLLLLLVLLIPAGYLVFAHVSGGAWPTLGLPIGGEEAWLRATTTHFWEDIQFKDFDGAAAYHAPDKQAAVDIPYLLERLFLLKPEALDIMSYEIVFAELDSTGLRARVKVRVRYKDLLLEDVREQEIILYYSRESEGSPWYMNLESSLRNDEAEKGKKH